MQVSKLICGILFLKSYKLLLVEEGSALSLEQRWYCGMSTVLGICLGNEAHYKNKHVQSRKQCLGVLIGPMTWP